MTCAWPKPPCEEWDPVRIGLLDYCEEHAAVVESNRSALIRTHEMRSASLANAPTRTNTGPYRGMLVGFAYSWRRWKDPDRA